MGENNLKIEAEDQLDSEVFTSLLLREGQEPSNSDDRMVGETLNIAVAETLPDKIRISMTKITMKNGHVRWQVSVKHQNSDGPEESNDNFWTPTPLSGLVTLVLKRLGVI